MTRIALILLLAAGTIVTAQEIDPGTPQEDRTTWDRFEMRTRTRFGTIDAGRMPEYLDYPHARFSSGLKFGRNNSFLGIDPETRGSRFRESGQPAPLLPSDYLSEKPAASREAVASANTPARGDVVVPMPQPRRSSGFFDRPGMMEPPEILPTESLIRTPAEQRWFRDLGRKPGMPEPGARPADETPEMVVGPEMLRMTELTPADSGSSVQRSFSTGDPAAQRRRFEQKLEGMLLTRPEIHFLSPVQISFQNGIATIRGVVPDQRHKVAAGNALLQDPAVKQVNNLISVISIDPAQNPVPIEPKP